jgi:hypothetical protein
VKVFIRRELLAEIVPLKKPLKVRVPDLVEAVSVNTSDNTYAA